jgi:hypothetical protein
MSISVLGISVDALDAARLANLWAQALYRTVDDGAETRSPSTSSETVASQRASCGLHGARRGAMMGGWSVPAAGLVWRRR